MIAGSFVITVSGHAHTPFKRIRCAAGEELRGDWLQTLRATHTEDNTASFREDIYRAMKVYFWHCQKCKICQTPC